MESLKNLAGLSLLGLMACGEGASGSEPFNVPSTPCGDLCASMARDFSDDAVQRLGAWGASPQCEITSTGLQTCVEMCEAEGATEACIDCNLNGDPGCNSICDGKRPREGRWKLLMSQTCWPEEPKPTAMCSGSGPSAGAQFSFPPLSDQISFTGTVSVVSRRPLELKNGDRSFQLGPELPSAQIGEVYHLNLLASCPFSCSGAYVLRESAGELIRSAWAGREPLPVSAFSLSYEMRSCLSAPFQYSSAIDINLIANGITVGVGQSVDIGDYRVINGQSRFHYAVLALDFPSGAQLGGMIERR